MKLHDLNPPATRRGTPPFLLLAVLLFWGWQSGFLAIGALMGIALEGARFTRTRWEMAEEDFRRIRNFCALLGLGLMVFVFSSNQEGGGLNGLLHANTLAAAHYVGTSATAFLRWLPIVVFLFVAAQFYSERQAIPLIAISWFFRGLRKIPGGAERATDISYPFFMICLFSAAIHTNEGSLSYFWGQCVLIAWALWSRRVPRYGFLVWGTTLALAMTMAYFGQSGLSYVQRLMEGYNAQWMANLFRPRTDPAQTITSMGQIGKLKLSPRIVIRLEPKPGSLPPDYLRLASYNRFLSDQQSWHSASSQADFLPIPYEPGNESAWPLVHGKTNTTGATIAAYLDGRSRETGDPEGLLPLPSGTSRLEKLPVFTLKKNGTGAVQATGLGLVIFDAYFGPGATIDLPPDLSTNRDLAKNRLDLNVPADEAPALARAIAEMNLSSPSESQKIHAIQQFFNSKFTYSTWLGPEKAPRNGQTALARFLFDSRSGHCEYFATATVLLLRAWGIPARYAVGYAVHEGSGRGYVIRERDAHAWCLVWNEGKGIWEDFDTTPASWVAAEAGRAPALQWLSDSWSWLRFQIAKIRWGQANLRQYILIALVPILGLLLFQIIFRRGRRRRLQSARDASAGATTWPGLDSEFYQLELKLAARGIPRQPGEPLVEWLRRPLADPSLETLRQPIQDLLLLHYVYRFDPRGLTSENRAALTRNARTCLDKLAEMKSRQKITTL